MTLGTINSGKPKPVNIAEVVQKAHDTFNRGVTRPLEWRRQQLKNLMRMYEENYNAMVDALQKDLRKSKTEAVLLEIDYLINDLRNLLHNLDDWAKPERIDRVLAEGGVRSSEDRRVCLKGFMNVKEAKKVCKNRAVWHYILYAYAGRDLA